MVMPILTLRGIEGRMFRPMAWTVIFALATALLLSLTLMPVSSTSSLALMLGFLIGGWATPSMSVGHLFYALGITGYILIGVQFEERDLVKFLGDDYLNYRRRVPMLFPWTKWGRTPDA